LFEVCFWFFRPPPSFGWLFMIQLLCTMRLYRPSLANSPSSPSFFTSSLPSFFTYSLPLDYSLPPSFLGCSFGLRRRAALASLLTRGGLMASCEWVCALRMEILSWRRSLMRCSFLR
jgi:hypothetical protein